MENFGETKKIKFNSMTVLLIVVLITIVIIALNYLIFIQNNRNNVQVTTKESETLRKDPNDSMILIDDPVKWPIIINNKSISETKTKIYVVGFEKGNFVPEEVIIQRGGKIQVGFTAKDVAYDVFFPATEIYLKIEKNSSSIIIMDTDSMKVGDYIFVCRDFCPDGKKIEGRLIMR